jgi:hypothetical protein
MAQVANVVSQQTLQFDVPGPVNGTRVFITTGIAQFGLAAFSQNANQLRQSDSVKLLVDPVLAPGQFRKSTAMVSFANVQRGSTAINGEFQFSSWSIDDITSSLDDESGKVELRFEVSVGSGGTNSNTQLVAVAFQVTSTATL